MLGPFQKLNIGGTEYETLIPERRKRGSGPHNPRELRAFIPGVVTQVLISPGQQVKVGTHLLSIEAMKMENGVRAEYDGVIRLVHVKAGDVVAKNALLVEIDPGGA